MGEYDEECDPSDCRSLWLSVIAQALVDAKSRSRKSWAKKACADASAWFGQLGEDSDFAQVCDLAGVRPAEIREVFRKVVLGEKTVDFRCLRKPKERIKSTTTKKENSHEQ